MKELRGFHDLPLSSVDIADLRSDHAGEAGAVEIYTGIVAVTRNPAVRAFAAEHRQTEIAHLRFFDNWLPREHRSSLLWVWRAAGWLLGAISASFGASAVFRTIAGVETFVERHYLEQIKRFRTRPSLTPLAERLQAFCDDEIAHRDDAAGRLSDNQGIAARLWQTTISAGSAAGVALARRF